MDEHRAERTAKRASAWRGRLLALLLSLTVGGIVCEVVVRSLYGVPLPEHWPLGMVQANPLRGWQMTPGDEHFTYQHPVRVNGLGLRGAELPMERDPQEMRVLTLGDSMLYGQGVAEVDTLPVRLEDLLGVDDPARRTWRVVNGGHRAYSTHQELALLEELGARVDPDAVVLLWYSNDFDEYDIEQVYRELLESGPRPFDVGLAEDGPNSWKWRIRQLARSSAAAMVLHDLVRDHQKPPRDPSYFDEGFDRLNTYLAQYAECCAVLGARPLLAVVPHSSTLMADNGESRRAGRVEDLARAHGVTVVELLPVLRQLYIDSGELPVIPYDGHYTGLANEHMARPLAAALVR